MSATPVLLVGKTVLSEAVVTVLYKGLTVLDERLDSYVRMIKCKRGERRNGKAGCRSGRKRNSIR